jgi:hypothetical protein
MTLVPSFLEAVLGMTPETDLPGGFEIQDIAGGAATVADDLPQLVLGRPTQQ